MHVINISVLLCLWDVSVCSAAATQTNLTFEMINYTFYPITGDDSEF